MTLNQVIQELKQIAESHAQIKHFFFGEGVDWTKLVLPYPAVLLQLEAPVRLIRNGGAEIDFSIIVCDQIYQAREDVNDPELRANSTEVMSDMLLIAEDLVALLDDPAAEWVLRSDPVQVQMLSEVQLNQDITAGVKIDFTLALPNIKDRCAVPVN